MLLVAAPDGKNPRQTYQNPLGIFYVNGGYSLNLKRHFWDLLGPQRDEPPLGVTREQGEWPLRPTHLAWSGLYYTQPQSQKCQVGKGPRNM